MGMFDFITNPAAQIASGIGSVISGVQTGVGSYVSQAMGQAPAVQSTIASVVRAGQTQASDLTNQLALSVSGNIPQRLALQTPSGLPQNLPRPYISGSRPQTGLPTVQQMLPSSVPRIQPVAAAPTRVQGMGSMPVLPNLSNVMGDVTRGAGQIFQNIPVLREAYQAGATFKESGYKIPGTEMPDMSGAAITRVTGGPMSMPVGAVSPQTGLPTIPRTGALRAELTPQARVQSPGGMLGGLDDIFRTTPGLKEVYKAGERFKESGYKVSPAVVAVAAAPLALAAGPAALPVAVGVVGKSVIDKLLQIPSGQPGSSVTKGEPIYGEDGETIVGYMPGVPRATPAERLAGADYSRKIVPVPTTEVAETVKKAPLESEKINYSRTVLPAGNVFISDPRSLDRSLWATGDRYKVKETEADIIKNMRSLPSRSAERRYWEQEFDHLMYNKIRDSSEFNAYADKKNYVVPYNPYEATGDLALLKSELLHEYQSQRAGVMTPNVKFWAEAARSPVYQAVAAGIDPYYLNAQRNVKINPVYEKYSRLPEKPIETQSFIDFLNSGVESPAFLAPLAMKPRVETRMVPIATPEVLRTQEIAGMPGVSTTILGGPFKRTAVVETEPQYDEFGTQIPGTGTPVIIPVAPGGRVTDLSVDQERARAATVALRVQELKDKGYSKEYAEFVGSKPSALNPVHLATGLYLGTGEMIQSTFFPKAPGLSKVAEGSYDKAVAANTAFEVAYGAAKVAGHVDAEGKITDEATFKNLDALRISALAAGTTFEGDKSRFEKAQSKEEESSLEGMQTSTTKGLLPSFEDINYAIYKGGLSKIPGHTTIEGKDLTRKEYAEVVKKKSEESPYLTAPYTISAAGYDWARTHPVDVAILAATVPAFELTIAKAGGVLAKTAQGAGLVSKLPGAVRAAGYLSGSAGSVIWPTLTRAGMVKNVALGAMGAMYAKGEAEHISGYDFKPGAVLGPTGSAFQKREDLSAVEMEKRAGVALTQLGVMSAGGYAWSKRDVIGRTAKDTLARARYTASEAAKGIEPKIDSFRMDVANNNVKDLLRMKIDDFSKSIKGGGGPKTPPGGGSPPPGGASPGIIDVDFTIKGEPTTGPKRPSGAGGAPSGTPPTPPGGASPAETFMDTVLGRKRLALPAAKGEVVSGKPLSTEAKPLATEPVTGATPRGTPKVIEMEWTLAPAEKVKLSPVKGPYEKGFMWIERTGGWEKVPEYGGNKGPSTTIKNLVERVRAETPAVSAAPGVIDKFKLMEIPDTRPNLATRTPRMPGGEQLKGKAPYVEPRRAPTRAGGLGKPVPYAEWAAGPAGEMGAAPSNVIPVRSTPWPTEVPKVTTPAVKGEVYTSPSNVVPVREVPSPMDTMMKMAPKTASPTGKLLTPKEIGTPISRVATPEEIIGTPTARPATEAEIMAMLREPATTKPLTVEQLWEAAKPSKKGLMTENQIRAAVVEAQLGHPAATMEIPVSQALTVVEKGELVSTRSPKVTALDDLLRIPKNAPTRAPASLLRAKIEGPPGQFVAKGPAIESFIPPEDLLKASRAAKAPAPADLIRQRILSVDTQLKNLPKEFIGPNGERIPTGATRQYLEGRKADLNHELVTGSKPVKPKAPPIERVAAIGDLRRLELRQRASLLADKLRDLPATRLDPKTRQQVPTTIERQMLLERQWKNNFEIDHGFAPDKIGARTTAAEPKGVSRETLLKQRLTTIETQLRDLPKEYRGKGGERIPTEDTRQMLERKRADINYELRTGQAPPKISRVKSPSIVEAEIPMSREGRLVSEIARLEKRMADPSSSNIRTLMDAQRLNALKSDLEFVRSGYHPSTVTKGMELVPANVRAVMVKPEPIWWATRETVAGSILGTEATGRTSTTTRYKVGSKIGVERTTGKVLGLDLTQVPGSMIQGQPAGKTTTATIIDRLFKQDWAGRLSGEVEVTTKTSRHVIRPEEIGKVKLKTVKATEKVNVPGYEKTLERTTVGLEENPIEKMRLERETMIEKLNIFRKGGPTMTGPGPEPTSAQSLARALKKGEATRGVKMVDSPESFIKKELSGVVRSAEPTQGAVVRSKAIKGVALLREPVVTVEKGVVKLQSPGSATIPFEGGETKGVVTKDFNRAAGDWLSDPFGVKTENYPKVEPKKVKVEAVHPGEVAVRGTGEIKVDMDTLMRMPPTERPGVKVAAEAPRKVIPGEGPQPQMQREPVVQKRPSLPYKEPPRRGGLQLLTEEEAKMKKAAVPEVEIEKPVSSDVERFLSAVRTAQENLAKTSKVAQPSKAVVPVGEKASIRSQVKTDLANLAKESDQYIARELDFYQRNASQNPKWKYWSEMVKGTQKIMESRKSDVIGRVLGGWYEQGDTYLVDSDVHRALTKYSNKALMEISDSAGEISWNTFDTNLQRLATKTKDQAQIILWERESTGLSQKTKPVTSVAERARPRTVEKYREGTKAVSKPLVEGQLPATVRPRTMTGSGRITYPVVRVRPGEIVGTVEWVKPTTRSLEGTKAAEKQKETPIIVQTPERRVVPDVTPVEKVTPAEKTDTIVTPVPHIPTPTVPETPTKPKPVVPGGPVPVPGWGGDLGGGGGSPPAGRAKGVYAFREVSPIITPEQILASISAGARKMIRAETRTGVGVAKTSTPTAVSKQPIKPQPREAKTTSKPQPVASKPTRREIPGDIALPQSIWKMTQPSQASSMGSVKTAGKKGKKARG